MNSKIKFHSTSEYYSASEYWLNDAIKDFPEYAPYYDMIAAILGCKRNELVILESLDENDEEGSYVEQFFPKDSAIKIQVEMTSVFVCNEESEPNRVCGMGDLKLFTADGIKFISEQNAGPIVIYANKNSIQ
jgi:hypothetical protein